METDGNEDAHGGNKEDKGARRKTFSEKGRQYCFERLKITFRDLKRDSDNIVRLMSDKAPVKTIEENYVNWMQRFETFMDLHNEYLNRLQSVNAVDDEYLDSYDGWDLFIRNFKISVESYLSTMYGHEQARQSRRHGDEQSQKGSKSSQKSACRSSKSSSIGSNLSDKRLEEEQRKAEYEARLQAFQRKKKLEMAKLTLQLEEEELEINTHIAVASAKAKVIDKFELLDCDQSIISKGSASPYVHVHSQQPDLGPTSNLNPNAEIFVAKDTANPLSLRTPANEPASNDIMRSVVQHLRKPLSDIRKFSGNPLEYRMFCRQFNMKIAANTDNDDEKLSYLEQFTLGEANKVVKGFCHMKSERAYAAAWQQLEERYGDNDVIATAFIKKALEWPPVKSGDPKSLDEFSLFLVECENAVESINATGVLEYSENIRLLMGKLPFYLHDRWRNIVFKRKEEKRTLKFSDFVEFVKRESKKANDPTYGNAAVSVPHKGNNTKEVVVEKHRKRNFTSNATVNQSRNRHTGEASNVVQHATTDAPLQKCLYCGASTHTLNSCEKILSLSLKERYNQLRSKGVCFGCLRIGHIGKNCRNRSTCSVCSLKHPTLLHDETKAVNKETKGDNSASVKDENESNCCIDCSSNSDDETGAGDTSSAMAIIPVKVRVKGKPYCVETYAFFDTGSSVTFCTEDIMYQLGCSGEKLQLQLNTMGNTQKINTYAISGLQVCDLGLEHEVNLPKVYTKDELPVSAHHIPKQNELEKWAHLSNISLPVIDANIGLMIGSNVPDAYTPFEVVTGPSGAPHATRGRLGWVVWNVIRENSGEQYDVNRVEMNVVKGHQDRDAELESLFRQSMNYDFPERRIDDKQENSLEDKSFLAQMNDSIHMEQGHYCISLPFREQNIALPNNASQGLQRLKGLKKKLSQNSKFKSDYQCFMDKLLDKGYAEIVPEDELQRNDGKVWYIPHHGVYHPRKPNKIRVVFDCSASYLGVSLNNELLQGPDLTSNLLGVLLRFREENVAIQGDIETMFYQVKVPKTDRDCLRFFWWPDGDLNREPVVHRMTVHLFGATSSPSCCNFALKRTVQDNRDDFVVPVTRSVEKDMYVDDYLSCAQNDDDAITLAQQVSSLCQRGGFRLTKWVSNSTHVLESIPLTERAKNTTEHNLEHDQQVERALGVCWLIQKDELGFRINISDRVATRRGILAIVSSVYDPLGVASPFILTAKSILQNLCKLELGWDEEIPPDEMRKWQKWLSQLNDLENITLQRCYKPQDFGKIVSCQLHAFSDASDKGIGTVFYLRMMNENEQVHCSFVLGKARVAPLKSVTIPRMELSAASRAVKLCRIIKDELNMHIDKTLYWTDSTSVLSYVANRNARFHTFVANRLAIIHEATTVDQWNYVNTKINPADLASRGVTVSKLDGNSLWFKGPDFLWKPETEWPKISADKTALKDDLEIKTVNTVSVTVKEEQNPMERLLSHFSNWNKLKRITGRLLTFMDFLRNKVKSKKERIDGVQEANTKDKKLSFKVTPEILCTAEKSLVRYVQRQYFTTELKMLQENTTLSKRTSKLYKLDPFIDSNGLLRVGGRLERADITYNAKHPIILPKPSQLSKLIIEHAHQSVGHLGKNSILALVRQDYWILGANVVIKNVVSKCVPCRKYQAPCLNQKMANLPHERLIPDEPPFSRVGMDYFGPFEIKRGRSIVKRYGVIFTCFATRAVHLEISHQLDTDSCIDAIRRFISRRGVPQSIRSDNGTNLVGAERELREEIQKWNNNIQNIENFMLQKNIQWEFNPPAGSHFGGVWERLIRSVRKVLYSLLHGQTVRLDDEGLSTLFCEVEAILNSRPLTEMSDNVNDLKVLTPNHLLLLRPGESFPPGTFNKRDNYVRRRWRQIQYLADIFWYRWTREYLPMLQSRQKWIKPKDNVKIGDVVLIADNSPRNMWNLGRVVEVMTDKHNVVRIVKVKTASTVLTRPISKLCLVLESD